MRVYPEKLAAHLQSGLAPIYLLTGDEPLQLEEAADAVAVAARERGFTEKRSFFAERGFDWNELAAAGASMSLFADKQLIELRLPTGKPGDQGARILAEYAANPPADTLLLIISGKLDRRARWVKALEKTGVVVQVWPVDAAKLPSWINRRLQQHRINAAPEAVRLIAERVEGNLLAARQEIDKLVLLYGPGSLDASQVSAAVTDSARYDLFQLVDMALLGQGERAVRMLDGLRAEGTEPVLILWALTREIRDLCSKAFLIAQGEPRAKVMASVWEKRKAAISRGLDHHTVRGLRRLLQCCNHIDRLVKGMRNGNVWDELLQLTMEVANSPVLQSKPARSV